MSTLARDKSEGNFDPPILSYAHHQGIIEHLHALSDLPALLEPATRARKIAAQSLAFFDQVIAEHHALEERELFPAVLECAARGEESERVKAIVERLTAEHRQVEAAWARLTADLNLIAIGNDADLDTVAVGLLVSDYWAHAAFEEEVFLPLAQTILGRYANRMWPLGKSLPLRDAPAAVGDI